VLAQRLHFNTFGGNPVCSAGGRAVLRAIDEDGIQANSAKVRAGLHLSNSLMSHINFAGYAACATCSVTSLRP
jgi:acetylornithine/succinyldiaminopimelate/putrescine aminotransferase